MAYGEPDAIHPADYAPAYVDVNRAGAGLGEIEDRAYWLNGLPRRKRNRDSTGYRMDRQAWGRRVADGDEVVERSKRRKAKRKAKAERKAKQAKAAGAPGTGNKNWRNRRRRVFERDGYRCVECGIGDELTVDHIRPLLHGGSDSVRNLQTMCRPCNNKKGNAWDGQSGHPAP